MPRRDIGCARRRWLPWIGIPFTWAVCALLLHTLAAHQLHTALLDDATHAIADERNGRTPYRWPLHSTDDLVSGNVFGGQDLHTSSNGLRVRAGAHTTEMGLKLRHAVDLQYYNVLAVRSSAPLRLLVRPTLAAPQCTSQRIAPVDGVIEIGLGSLDWQCEEGSPAAAPAQAEMLRLQVLAEPGEMVTMHDVQLTCHAEGAACAPLPRLELAMHGRIEQILSRRDALRSLPGAAIIVPALPESAVASLAPEQPRQWGLYSFALLYACAVLLAWRWPPARPRLRAGVQAALACAGPLIVVIGGHYGSRIDAGVVAVAAISLLVVTRLAWHSRGILRRAWQPYPAASWLLPALTVVAALLLIAIAGPAAGTGWHVGPREIALYLVWAALQQLWIGVLVANRAGITLHSRPAGALVAAMVFALLHTPNAMLMQLSLIGGAVWFHNWQRHGTLVPGVVAHAACGLLLRQLGPEWLRSAEVSARFFL